MIAINPYLFGDAGIIGQPLTSKNNSGNTITKNVYSHLLADAGIGASINLKNWGKLTKNRALTAAKPLNFRVDFPVWVSAVQQNDSHLKFRVRFSVGADF
jgi:hypothetical protein